MQQVCPRRSLAKTKSEIKETYLAILFNILQPFYLAILRHFLCTFLACLFGHFSITLAGNKGNKLMLNKQSELRLSLSPTLTSSHSLSPCLFSPPLPLSFALPFPFILCLPRCVLPIACSSSAFRIYSAKFAALPPRVAVATVPQWALQPNLQQHIFNFMPVGQDVAPSLPAPALHFLPSTNMKLAWPATQAGNGAGCALSQFGCMPHGAAFGNCA